MRIIFCNTTYLRYYDGRIAGELKPISGGRWVQENEDAHEKWNFLNMDGYCYGFVQGISDNIHIERIDKSLNKQEHGDNVIVVWCAKLPDEDKTVIVGWYENATIFRYDQYLRVTPLTGLERCYQFVVKAEDAYLLPEEERTMEIGRASKTGTGTGFGQMNYWFADSEYAKEHVIPNVLEFIENHKKNRINVLPEAFEPPTNMKPVTRAELDEIEDIDALSPLEYLPIGYRLYHEYGDDAEGAYTIAKALCDLHQYTKAVDWFEKVVELDPDDWESKAMLAYLYSQCEMYEAFIAMAKSLLDGPEATDSAYRDEVYCMLADGYFFSQNIKEAISWQEKIIAESKNKDLIGYTKNLKKEWMELL